MEIIAIVVMFLAFIGFRELTHIKHIRDLETKLVARNASEYVSYKRADEPQDNPTTQQQGPELFDVSGLPFEDYTRIRRGENE